MNLQFIHRLVTGHVTAAAPVVAPPHRAPLQVVAAAVREEWRTIYRSRNQQLLLLHLRLCKLLSRSHVAVTQVLAARLLAPAAVAVR